MTDAIVGSPVGIYGLLDHMYRAVYRPLEGLAREQPLHKRLLVARRQEGKCLVTLNQDADSPRSISSHAVQRTTTTVHELKIA